MPTPLRMATARGNLPGRIIAVLTLAAGVCALAGCGTDTASAAASSAGAAGDTNVTVAAVPATGAVALYIAQDDGLFARAGLDVTIESSVSASDPVSGLLDGKVDVSLGQWTTA